MMAPEWYWSYEVHLSEFELLNETMEVCFDSKKWKISSTTREYQTFYSLKAQHTHQNKHTNTYNQVHTQYH